MTRRLLTLPAIPIAIALVALIAPRVATQTHKFPRSSLTAYNGGSPTSYVTPKTPWGEPTCRVCGAATTLPASARATAELETRLYQTDAEFAARKKQIDVGVQRGEHAVGSFRNDFATRAFRQTSLIVDPPDGRMPMTTAAAEKRRASRESRHVRRRSVQHL
jgi:hypothetical protein